MKKDFICKFLYASGVLKLIQWVNHLRQKRVTILMFHRVGKYCPGEPAGLPTLFVQPESFRQIVDVIQKHYTVISMSEYCRRISNKEQLPRNSLVITFDDGYRDSFRNAFPLLKQHHLPFLLYLPSALLNGGVDYWWDRLYNLCVSLPPKQLIAGITAAQLENEVEADLRHAITDRWEDPHSMALGFVETVGDLQTSQKKKVVSKLENIFADMTNTRMEASEIMDFSDVKTFLKMGGEIGSHTISHLFLDKAPETMVWEEVVTSKKAIEKKLNVEVLSFAYPAGKVTRAVRDIVEKAGYRNACTIAEGVNDRQDDPYLLKRVNVSEELIVDRDGRFSAAIFMTRLVLSDFKRFKGIKRWRFF